MQAYTARVGRQGLLVSSTPSKQGGLSNGLKFLPQEDRVGEPNSRFNSVLHCIVFVFFNFFLSTSPIASTIPSAGEYLRGRVIQGMGSWGLPL